MSSRRRVAVLGPGRVGTAVALGLARAGHRVVAAVDGGGGSAAALAPRVAGCRVVGEAAAAVRDADLVLVTCPDDRVAEVVTGVAVADAWRPVHHVVHCSGALGLDALRRAALAGARTAAVHPAQTVPEGADHEALVGAAWAVTAAPADRAWAHALVGDLGGDPFDLAAGDRVLYHAGLVLGANAAGAAVAAGRQLLHAARVPGPERVLGPLAHASVANVLAGGAAALTGPVVRGDVGTVAAHLAALDADVPTLAATYRRLQLAVLQQVRPSLPPAAALALDGLLAPSGPTSPAGPAPLPPSLPPAPDDVAVRAMVPGDAEALWQVLEPVLREGTTYAVDPRTGREEALAWWTGPPHDVLVAERDGQVLGTCFVQPNSGGGGWHVANAGFATAASARGAGVARALCHAALAHARSGGHTAMQFNAVVAGNTRAVALWRAFGFAEVGRVPGGFRHPDGTHDDVLVLHRHL